MSFEGGGGEADDPSSGMEMTVDEEAASIQPREEDARSKLASSGPAADTFAMAAAGGVVAFSLDEDVVASSSSIEGQDGVDSSILLSRSFKALSAICLLLSASSALVPGRLTVIDPEGAAILYRCTWRLQIFMRTRRLKMVLATIPTTGEIGSGKNEANMK